MGDWLSFNFRCRVAGISSPLEVAQSLAVVDFGGWGYIISSNHCLGSGAASKLDWWLVYRPLWFGDLSKSAPAYGYPGSIAQRSGSGGR